MYRRALSGGRGLQPALQTVLYGLAPAVVQCGRANQGTSVLLARASTEGHGLEGLVQLLFEKMVSL